MSINILNFFNLSAVFLYLNSDYVIVKKFFTITYSKILIL